MLATVVQFHLAAEHAVDEGEVADGGNYANRPPHKAAAQSMGASGRIVDPSSECTIATASCSEMPGKAWPA